MEFFEAVSRRRSIRNYSDRSVPSDVVNRAIDAALLAPNSSNMQTWKIHWVRDQKKKRELALACMNQGAARTAQELLVFTADASLWKKTRPFLLDSIKDNPRKDLHAYYGKLMPAIYGYRWLAPAKWLVLNVMGLFKPMVRDVVTSRDLREVSVKSTALACENFMLAIAAQGFDTCPMEGFDRVRVRKILKLPRSAAIVMVISVGERTERGVWGERFRIPRSEVVSEV
jgi:nitroreductase